jgi:hypothetical protein
VTRAQLEHLIRAAATIADDDELVVIGATGWCLEIHDLVVSKYVANREKDASFVKAAIRHGLVDESVLRERVGLTEIADDVREAIVARIGRDFA